MSFTRRSAARSALAVPPVEISSTPKPASVFANSTRPVLSVTLSRARRMRLSEGTDEVKFVAPTALAGETLQGPRIRLHGARGRHGTGHFGSLLRQISTPADVTHTRRRESIYDEGYGKQLAGSPTRDFAAGWWICGGAAGGGPQAVEMGCGAGDLSAGRCELPGFFGDDGAACEPVFADPRTAFWMGRESRRRGAGGRRVVADRDRDVRACRDSSPGDEHVVPGPAG